MNNKINDSDIGFPWYVNEYFDNSKLGFDTLNGYKIDLLTFFEWLINNNTVTPVLSDIKLSELEKLSLNDFMNYRYYLENDIVNKLSNKIGLSNSGVARKLSSVSSLYNYLVNVAEYDNGDSYLIKNFPSQVRAKSIKKSDTQLAEEAQENRVSHHELLNFRNFIKSDYENIIKSSKTQLSFFKRDKERDIAILSLLFDTGLRTKEIASLEMSNVDLTNKKIYMTNERTIVLTDQSKHDLLSYLQIRIERYDTTNNMPFVFLSKYNKKANRITVRSIQLMIKKYAKLYDVESITAQSFRHSFATRLFKHSYNLQLVQEQLGQTHLNSSSLHSHLYDDLL